MKLYKINKSHENIFQTYKELKRILPNGYFKIKVFKKQRYPINKKSIINEMENNFYNINKNKFSSFQNINIFFNENNENNRKYKKIKYKRNNSIKESKTNNQNNLNLFSYNNNYKNGNELITYRNFREKNMKIVGINCDIKMKRNKGLYNSFSVNDIDLKKNIYLPKIIDRMKFNIPRNLRNNRNFIVSGYDSKNIIDKYKELNFINNKNNIPTNFFFYKNKKKENKSNVHSKKN